MLVIGVFGFFIGDVSWGVCHNDGHLPVAMSMAGGKESRGAWLPAHNCRFEANVESQSNTVEPAVVPWATPEVVIVAYGCLSRVAPSRLAQASH